MAKTHGMSKTSVYKTWASMKRRCNDKNNKRYGGRGISYCDRWEKFENFLFDMGDRPGKLTLDRTNNDGNYTPENCRWATMEQQANNSSRNCRILFNGQTKTIGEWSKITGLSQHLISRRIKIKKMSINDALTMQAPCKKKRKIIRQGYCEPDHPSLHV